MTQSQFQEPKEWFAEKFPIDFIVSDGFLYSEHEGLWYYFREGTADLICWSSKNIFAEEKTE